MTIRGHVENGMVVLDEPVALPEGATVQVELTVPSSGPSLGRKLLRHAGKAQHLPSDAAQNHNHCLYGTDPR